MSSDVRAVLEERARRLAQPPPPPAPDDLTEVVIFARTGSRYAAEARFVVEVRPLSDLARVPRAPDVLLGVTALRSRIVPLLETDVLVGRRRPDQAPSAVVVLADRRAPLGLAADRLVGVETLSLATVRDAKDDSAPIVGPTPDGITLLSGDAVLDLPPIFAPDPATSSRSS